MGRELKRVLVEVLVVATMGLAFALVANHVSPRGLSLTVDYFPRPAREGGPSSGTGAHSNLTVTAHATNALGHSALEKAMAHLRENGLQPIDGQEVIQLFRDPQYEQELIVFIDARDDRHYQEGHIPGAYQFDRYYPEKYLSAVLPACLNATKIVVYCAGVTETTNCEDSEFAAAALKDAGVARERIFVYVGGMTEWATKGPSFEIGERKSGNLRSAK